MKYQPGRIFNAHVTSERNCISATKTVQALLDRYDAVPLSPEISIHAEAGTTESRHYFALDEEKSAECPYQSLGDEVSLTGGKDS